jgi:hypothetical protein
VVAVPTVDRRRWIAERLAFLRALDRSELSEEQCAAIDAEIEALKKERRRGLLGWLSGAR